MVPVTKERPSGARVYRLGGEGVEGQVGFQHAEVLTRQLDRSGERQVDLTTQNSRRADLDMKQEKNTHNP